MASHPPQATKLGHARSPKGFVGMLQGPSGPKYYCGQMAWTDCSPWLVECCHIHLKCQQNQSWCWAIVAGLASTSTYHPTGPCSISSDLVHLAAKHTRSQVLMGWDGTGRGKLSVNSQYIVATSHSWPSEWFTQVWGQHSDWPCIKID